jgi:hypothetical protein
MTTQKATLNTEQLVYTFGIRILFLSRLEPKFQHSLSAVTPGIYLCGSENIAAKSSSRRVQGNIKKCSVFTYRLASLLTKFF